MEELTAILAQQQRIALDTKIFIYHFESHPRFGPVAATIFQTVEAGLGAVTSMITLMEVLILPKRMGLIELYDRHLFTLLRFPHLELLPVDRALAEQAAQLRATYPTLRALDALNLGAGLLRGATLYVTNDERARQVREVPVCYLGAFA